jgi:hypothetical protein
VCRSIAAHSHRKPQKAGYESYSCGCSAPWRCSSFSPGADIVPQQDQIVRSDNPVTVEDIGYTVSVGDTAHYASDISLDAPPQLVSKQPSATQSTDAPDQMFCRSRKLDGYNWLSSAARGTTTQIPITVEHVRSLDKIMRYTDFRYMSYKSLDVTITPPTSSMYRGLLGVTWVPSSSPVDKDLTPTGLSSLATTYIDAASTDSIKVSIPWWTPFPKYVSSSIADAGRLVIWVVSPLTNDQAPTVTTSALLQIETNFVDGKLLDPCALGQTVPEVVARVTTAPIAGAFFRASAPRSVAREAKEKAEKGTVSTVLDSVSSIASYATALPIVGPFAGGVSCIAKAASSVFDWFGLSKPPNLTTPQYVLPRSSVGQINIEGVSSVECLSGRNLPMVSTDPHLVNSTQDGCNLMTFAQRPTLIQVAKTETQVTLPKRIVRIPVQPFYGWKAGARAQPSNMAFAAKCFRNWRGEIAYKIIIPGNAYTRCRLAICYALIDDAGVFSEANRFMYVEVNGTKTIEFTVPMTHYALYLPSPNGDVGTNPTNNGYITIYQLTDNTGIDPVTAPVPTELCIFAACTANTQFAGICDPTYERPCYKNITGATGIFGFEESVKVDKILADDDIYSIRELLHRYQNAATWQALTGTQTAPHNLPLLYSNRVKYFLWAFRYFRGSRQFRFVSRAATASTVSIHHVNGVDSEPVLWNPSQSPIFEILTPFLEHTAFDSTGGGANYTSQQTSLFVRCEGVDTAQNVSYRVDCSFADDLSLGSPVAPPFLET